KRDSVGSLLLAGSLVLLSVLLAFQQFHHVFLQIFGRYGHFLGPIPQLLLGIGMLMVLFENERRAVQENALAFSTLDLDTSGLLSPDDLSPSMDRILKRLAGLVPARQGCLLIGQRWRAVLPSAQCGLTPGLLGILE